jgi:hypothetical protein
MSVDVLNACANYQALADLSSLALRHARERNWDALAALREQEAMVIAQLCSAEAEQPSAGAERTRMEALLVQTLNNQHEALALLLSWRDEVTGQLRSIISSRKLARAYGDDAARA